MVTMDVVDRKTRSRMMAGITGRNTKPEVLVRKYLHAQGFRFRIHDSRLPGRPDVVLKRYRTVVFVNGCFWHRHPGCRFATIPGTNTERWCAKFDANVRRDARNISLLRTQHWSVIVLWECGIRRAETGLSFLVDWIRDGVGFRSWPE